MITFRDLREDEIEVRIQSVCKEEKGIILLLYKNARADMNILDETVEAENWKREHYKLDDDLYCRIGIYCTDDDGTKHWVYKSDCGTESNTEAVKGRSSDSFKRAAVNWGIGRELYTAPFLYVPADKCNIKNGKCYDHFEVEKIRIEDKKITGLAIRNATTGKRCFLWQKEGENRG